MGGGLAKPLRHLFPLRTRPGRRGCEASQTAGAEEEDELDVQEVVIEPLPLREVGLFRTAAARADYLALARPGFSFCPRMCAGA